ncbi:TMEM143 family protein [Thermodesulfobacteriota bacterium]
MTDDRNRDRYIPFRKQDIVRMLLDEGRLGTEDERRDFNLFCKVLASIFHFEFHESLEKLKDSYYPLNPDLKKWGSFSPEELESSSNELFKTLLDVLNHANYDEISAEEIERAQEASAALKVTIVVDMDDYETVKLFYRGRRVETMEIKELYGLRKRTIEEEVLERVVLMVRFKPKEYFDAKSGKSLPFEPDSTIIKLFKDVPRKDLEILFPNSRAVMATKDKLLLVVPAVAGGVPLLLTKVWPALLVTLVVVSAYLGIEGTVQENQLKQAIAAFSALAALGGFCLKQWMKYKNKRYEFQKELSDNLYFRNLVNNVGVFHSLIDAAEEEECKEAFLAYYFLLTSDGALTEPELDRLVESWFETGNGCILDFECDDALGKLQRLNLLEKKPDGSLQVPGLEAALARLDELWDGFFEFSKPEAC